MVKKAKKSVVGEVLKCSKAAGLNVTVIEGDPETPFQKWMKNNLGPDVTVHRLRIHGAHIDGRPATEEEAIAAAEDHARELYPDVPPHITIGLTMLRDKINDISALFALDHGLEHVAELMDCACMVDDILNAVSDAFSDDPLQHI
ncbi:MAG: hypothetical protein FWH34_01055 [Desulfovibrionaceae bacterium]|nr:hypothetical protein [Desulfovibrionaceae bacterium]